MLIQAGAVPSFRHPTRCDETPLHWAASSDDVDVAAALIDGGADILIEIAVSDRRSRPMATQARLCSAASSELLPGCYAPLGRQLRHPGGGGSPLGWWRCHHDELGHADPGELGE